MVWQRSFGEFLAFVALKLSLLDKLLRLGPDGSVMAIGELPFLIAVYGPPSRRNVDTAADTNLLARLSSVGGRGKLFPIRRANSTDGRGTVCCRRRRNSAGCGECSTASFGRCCQEICLSHSSREGQISLLKILYVKLQRIEAAVADNVMHPVGNGLGRNMILAPQQGGHGTALAINCHNVKLVASRTLNRGNVESQKVACLSSTLHMKGCAAVMARNAGSIADLVARRANLVISQFGN